MEPLPKNAGGRPRAFDRDIALELAMRLFWRHGFDGVTLEQLTTAMNIAPPSLYAAFGNKADLYRAALRRYGRLDLTVVRQAPELREAVRLVLEDAIASITDPDREPGCMVSSGMIEVHPSHQPLADETALRRKLMRDELADVLGRFVDKREASSIAFHLSAVLTGLSVQARDGVPRDELQLVANEVVAGLVNRPSDPSQKRDDDD